MPEVVYINGEYTDFANAKVSVDDRGFVFGDGVYEVIRVYPRTGPFQIKPHLERLMNSCAGIEIGVPWSAAEIEEICYDVLQRSEQRDGIIYIEITRGAAPRAHLYPTDARPTLVVYTRPFKGSGDLKDRGVAVVTIPDDRWAHCNWKTINLLPNIMGKQRAHHAGAWEGIFVREGGIVTEGTSSNLMIVTGGVVLTHPADNRILPGITRSVVLEICRDQGIRAKEERFTEDVLLTADEAFLSGTTTEIMPIVRINDRVVGGGKPGPVTKQIQAAYAALIGQ
ncbi:MAG: D-amino-acid transaminase [Chloroflexota bacterium]